MTRQTSPPRSVKGRAGTVSVAVVRRIYDIGVGAGVPADVLLKAAGITADGLRDPDARLPIASRIALWEAIARYVSDPSFGVRAGAAGRARQFGLLGYIVAFSATLRDALHRGQRYGRLLTDEVSLELEEFPGRAVLTLLRLAPGPEQPLSQDFRLSAWLQVCRELTGIDIVPVEVSFAHTQPASVLAHRQHFRCPLRFDASSAAMVLRSADLDLAVVRADETLAGYLSKYAEQVLHSLVHGDTWRHTVRATIWSLLADGKPSLSRVADALGIPSRTLQRRLASEGTSLHAETEEIRKTMAMALLRDASTSVAHASALLGYAEPSAFFRSFRRWTGKTPRDYRRSAA